MKSSHICIGVLSLMFIAGCGAASHHIAGPSDQNVGPVDRKGLSSDIVGTWLGPCEKLSNSSSNQQELSFSRDKKFASNLREFSNTSCSGSGYFYSDSEVTDATYGVVGSPGFSSGQVQIGADKDQTRLCPATTQGVDPLECMIGPVRIFIGSNGSKLSLTFNSKREVFNRVNGK